MELKNNLYILNLLLQPQINLNQIQQSLTISQFTLPKQFPKTQLSKICSSLKMHNYQKIQNTFRDIVCRFRYPCLHYSTLCLLIISNLVLQFKPTESDLVIKLIMNIIQKLHLYSIQKSDMKTEMVLFSILNYMNNTLNKLISILLEKDLFQKILSMVSNLLSLVQNNSIKTIGQILLIIKINQFLLQQSKKQFILFVLSLIKTKDKYDLFNYIFVESNNTNQLNFNKIGIFRLNQTSLEKIAVKLNDAGKIQKQVIKSKNWPVWIQQAYKSTPQILPIELKDYRKFSDIYNILLLLQVFGNSPRIQSLEDYFEEQFITIFLKFLTCEKISQQNYEFKNEKWKVLLAQLERVVIDSNKQDKQNKKMDVQHLFI